MNGERDVGAVWGVGIYPATNISQDVFKECRKILSYILVHVLSENVDIDGLKNGIEYLTYRN